MIINIILLVINGGSSRYIDKWFATSYSKQEKIEVIFISGLASVNDI